MTRRSGHITEFPTLDQKTASYLVSGPDDNRNAWGFAVWPDVLDSGGKTTHVRIFLGMADDPKAAEERLIEAAKDADITLQRLEHVELENRKVIQKFKVGDAEVTEFESGEQYPVVHLGTHGMKWSDK